MNIERLNHNGHIVITDIKDNQLIKQSYIGYTLKEAKRAFKKYLNGVN